MSVNEAAESSAVYARAIMKRDRVILELVAALRRVEFDVRGFCPACDGFNVGPNGSTGHRHTVSCPVAVALAKAAP